MSGAELWAHSVNATGRRHGLRDHLVRVGNLAAEMAHVFNAGEAAAMAGRIHDIGKALPAWQEGLLRAERGGGPVGIDHKMAGTKWILDLDARLGPVVYGHHGGLPTMGRIRDDLCDRHVHVSEAITAAAAAGLLPERPVGSTPEGPSSPSALSRWIRMVFSVLVDADWLDTEAHFRPGQGSLRGRGPALDVLDERLSAYRVHLHGVGSPQVQRLREALWDAVRAAAAGPTGMLRLAAPTGSGKTLAGLGFALEHARFNGLRRVVVAVPFTSITTQTAQVYRDALGADAVLEHHSATDPSNETGWSRLAVENWDAPVVVTTTVQLLESLHANKPARCRKIHNLARAVVVLDEVQALPTHALDASLRVLRGLVEEFGSTVVLSTATQPSFWRLSPFRDLAVTDIAKGLPAPPHRVTVDWSLRRLTLDDLADKVAGEDTGLAVVNTTSDAARLTAAVLERRDTGVFHLSSRMTNDHRRQVLRTVVNRLSRSLPTLLVATQVVEAGVDLDFPRGWRAVGPAEAVVQVAGRINRNGHLSIATLEVVDVTDGHFPDRGYATAARLASAHFGSGPDPADPDALDRYYRALYPIIDPEGQGEAIRRAEAALDFPAIAEFRLIRDDTTDVIVDWPTPTPPNLIGALRDPAGVRDALRRLRARTVSIPTSQAQRAVETGNAVAIEGSDLLRWTSEYHPVYGLADPGRSPDG